MDQNKNTTLNSQFRQWPTVRLGVMRSHIYNKLTQTASNAKTSQGILVRSRKWILHTHTKGNKCLHLASNGQQAPFWAIPIGLVIHSKVAAVRRKVALPLRQGCVSEVDLGLSALKEEGGVAKCPAGALFWVAPWAQQAAVSLNNPALLWPDRHYAASQWNHHAVSATSIGFRFHGDFKGRVRLSTSQILLIHWKDGTPTYSKSHLSDKMFPIKFNIWFKVFFFPGISQKRKMS